MQVIDVLGDYVDSEMLFKFNKANMPVVGVCQHKLTASLVVKAVNQRRISAEAVGACDLHYRVLLPQTSCVAESGDATFRTHARAG